VRKVYLLPNLFTTASLLCGMLAITRVLAEIPDNHLRGACWLILLATILDVLDGKIARITRSESNFGINYDSLSDLVVFGVAPAVLMFSALSDEGSMKVATGVTTLYVICGALRLARFNVQRMREEKRSFTGLPIPAAAGAVVSVFLVYNRFDQFSEFSAKALPFVLVILSCLMVSKIPYPSAKHLKIEGRKPFDYLVSIILALCIVLVLWHYLDCLLLAAFFSYIVYGAGRAARDVLHHLRSAATHETTISGNEPQESSPMRK